MTQSIRPKTRIIDGPSVRYAESEPRDHHALLFSPWPESIYAYEPTWNRLANDTHLVATWPKLKSRHFATGRSLSVSVLQISRASVSRRLS